MAQKNRKREGRRLAERQALRERLRIQQAGFEDQIVWRRGSPAAPVKAPPEPISALELKLQGPAQVAGLQPREFQALVRLGEAVDRSKLLDDQTRASPRLPLGPANSYLGGLIQLAKSYRRWIREPEQWKRRSHNRGRQFASLARHLLVEYPVPLFMDEAWFTGSTVHQEWFLRIGRGHNLRHERSLPIPMTRRMVHEFLRAPDDLGILQAMRWAQAAAQGAPARTARAILGTRIGASFEHDEFWSTVVRFFIANPMLDTVHYGPIVDYLHHQRFVPPVQADVNGRLRALGPAQPNLSMKGRTPEALLREVRSWHADLARLDGRQGRMGARLVMWTSCGVPGFEQAEGVKGERVWVVRELLSSAALIEEGREMGHCVATYSGSCAMGRSAIFSMLLFEKGGVERRLTISVDPRTRTVTEAAGRFNAAPRDVDRRVLAAWAVQTGLTVPRWA